MTDSWAWDFHYKSTLHVQYLDKITHLVKYLGVHNPTILLGTVQFTHPRLIRSGHWSLDDMIWHLSLPQIIVAELHSGFC